MSAEELYQQAIKTLAQEATGRGRLEPPAAHVRLENPLCGDRVDMYVRLEGGRVAALAHEVKGCLLCRAAAAAIGRRAPGARPEEIERVAAHLAEALERGAATQGETGWEELAAFAPVHGHRSRYGCVLLPFKALAAAVGFARREDEDGRAHTSGVCSAKRSPNSS